VGFAMRRVGVWIFILCTVSLDTRIASNEGRCSMAAEDHSSRGHQTEVRYGNGLGSSEAVEAITVLLSFVKDETLNAIALESPGGRGEVGANATLEESAKVSEDQGIGRSLACPFI
jgi:hypothetical protein